MKLLVPDYLDLAEGKVQSMEVSYGNDGLTSRLFNHEPNNIRIVASLHISVESILERCEQTGKR